MKRRDFLRLAAMAPIISAAPRVSAGLTATEWRAYELTYSIDLSRHPAAARLWLPLPQHAGEYQRVLSVGWKGEADIRLLWDTTYQAPILHAVWDARNGKRQLIVSARVATRDRKMSPVVERACEEATTALYLRPSPNMPVDGIVRDTAERIVKGIRDPDERALAIYEWIVENTFRDPKTRGCGMGDIKTMLETGYLGGKCADINSLFVGLARAAGLPAREFYGVRVAESVQFKSLGKGGDISKAQHCRAEYFSPRHGWVAVDPADVRKAVLEEKLPLTDPRIVELRRRLFGFWQMNWVGFNYARDFALPGGGPGLMPYLMYPYAEIGTLRLDGRDPDEFQFRLSSREVPLDV